LAGGDISITASNLKIRGSTAMAGLPVDPNNPPAGAFNLTVTNSISDGGSDAGNVISMSDGFNMLIKPALGDLIGTTFVSTSAANQNIVHVWAGQDRGPFPGGFTNNVAVGTLSLSTSPVGSVMTFTGAGTNNALYVDLLELNGDLTANYATELLIDTNMMIYFANANVAPETLDGALNGRLRWVRSFAGPNSSADVQLSNGTVIQVNSALLNSTTIDSDGDGTANAFDPSPFDGVLMNSVVTLSKGTANVSWTAAAETVYTVQVANKMGNPVPWTTLLNYTNNATATGTVTIQDTSAGSSPVRFYRVLYTP
jgi:hypothetical protein